VIEIEILAGIALGESGGKRPDACFVHAPGRPLLLYSFAVMDVSAAGVVSVACVVAGAEGVPGAGAVCVARFFRRVRVR
jgi:hypothetical protein